MRASGGQIVAQPSAIVAAGQAARDVADATREVAGQVNANCAAPAAAHPTAAGALSRMLSAWGAEFGWLETGCAQIGSAAIGAAADYQATDQTVMPGPGGGP